MMYSVHHLFLHIRTYGFKHKALWAFCIMLFFLLIFDGMLSYTIPLLITQKGLSKTQMGFIIGSSSLVGALFDILLSKILKNTHFRRLFMGVFVVAFFYALVLWGANAVILYVLAMALWGIWFDLMSFGTYNFVGRSIVSAEHASSFGVIDIFRSCAYLIAPLLAGLIITDKIDPRVFLLALVFFSVAVGMYFVVVALTVGNKEPLPHTLSKKFPERAVWLHVVKHLWPVLIMVIFMGIFDSFFLTIGPLISEELSAHGSLSELFIPLYFLPLLFIGWFVGPITSRFGKKRTAFVTLFVGCIPLLFFPFTKNVFELLLLVFLSSLLNSIAWPATKGAIADYVGEASLVEKEIEAVTDFAGNSGFIIGPILAGIAADKIGNLATFAALGGVSMVICLILLKFTPRHIHIPNRL